MLSNISSRQLKSFSERREPNLIPGSSTKIEDSKELVFILFACLKESFLQEPLDQISPNLDDKTGRNTASYKTIHLRCMKQLNCTQQITLHLDYKHFPAPLKVFKCCPVGKYQETVLRTMFTTEYRPLDLKELDILFMTTAATSPNSESIHSFAHFVLL